MCEIDGRIKAQIEYMVHRKHGLWEQFQSENLRNDFLADLNIFGVFNDAGMGRLSSLERGKAANFENVVSGLLANLDYTSHPAAWNLYWAVSHASHELLLFMRQGMHEPVLTGAFMAFLHCAIKSATTAEGNDVVAVHVADHQALWNEKRSGADFGIIVEVSRNGIPTYNTMLVQAKRAPRQRISADLDQATVLFKSLIGAYLFYNEFSCRSQGGKVSLTMKSAEVVLHELLQRQRRLEVLKRYSDFALMVAFGMTRGINAPGYPYQSPDEALAALFDVELKSRLNHVLVTVVGERRFPIEEIVRCENEWRERVERQMRVRRSARPSPAQVSLTGP